MLVHHAHQHPAGLQRRAGKGPGCVDAGLQPGEQVPLVGVTGKPFAERLVATGSVSEVFTHTNIQRTYGARLTVLDDAAEAVRKAGGA